MSEGEAFVNPMAAYLVRSGRGHTESKKAEPGRRRRRGSAIRLLVEVVAAVAVSAIVVITVARGGGAVGDGANATAPIAGTTTGGPAR